MDFKKFMQKKSDDNPLITEGDEEFFNNVILSEVQKNAEAPKRKNPMRTVWACVSAAATVLAAVVITVSVVFANRGPSPVFYQDENVVHIESTIEELQRDLKFIDLTQISSNCSVDRSYDSESTDTLYYHLEDKIGVADINLILVTNVNYNYNFEIINETTKQLDSYSVIYNSEVVSDITGLPKMQYSGWIKVQTETVYFEYQQLLMMGDDAFFEGIQNIIKVK